jgi:hypothetical protein
MGFGTSLWSIFVPWHVDWIPILLFIAFSAYFWVQLVYVFQKHPSYRLKSKKEWDAMTIATIGIVFGVTCSALRFLFYSISERARGAFDTLDYMGRTMMVFLFTIAFVITEVGGSNEYAKWEKTRYHDYRVERPKNLTAWNDTTTTQEPRDYTYQGESNQYYDPYMYALLAVLVINLILAFWSWGKKIATWFSVILMTVIYATDYIFYARDDQKI